MNTIIYQLVFAIWFFIIHFIPIPPVNDIDKFPNKPTWKLFLFINWVLLMILILGSFFYGFYFKIFLILYLSLILFGHINTWWLPYLFGWPKVFVEDTEIDHKVTLRFLPPKKNRPVPDVGYIILGLTCLMALIMTFKSLNN